MTTVAITVTRDGEAKSIVWTDGEMAGDEALLGLIEAKEEAESEVLVTPTGPLMAVDRAEVRSVIVALEEYGPTEVDGTLPDPTWETDETRGRDLDW